MDQLNYRPFDRRLIPTNSIEETIDMNEIKGRSINNQTNKFNQRLLHFSQVRIGRKDSCDRLLQHCIYFS